MYLYAKHTIGIAIATSHFGFMFLCSIFRDLACSTKLYAVQIYDLIHKPGFH